MLLNYCYCPYIRTTLKYVHHFANIAKAFEKVEENVNYLVDEQREKNKIYLADVKKVESKKSDTKEQKKEIKKAILAKW